MFLVKGPYPHILKLWEESSTAQHMISYRKPTFLWLRGFRLELVTKLSVRFCLCSCEKTLLIPSLSQVKQQGNTAGSHCAYFYRKIRDEIPRGIAVEAPVAIAEAAVAEPVGVVVEEEAQKQDEIAGKAPVQTAE